MKQIKFPASVPGQREFLVTLFLDGTVEVEQRMSQHEIWSPIRRDLVEITDSKEGEMQ